MIGYPAFGTFLARKNWKSFFFILIFTGEPVVSNQKKRREKKFTGEIKSEEEKVIWLYVYASCMKRMEWSTHSNRSTAIFRIFGYLLPLMLRFFSFAMQSYFNVIFGDREIFQIPMSHQFGILFTTLRV